MTCRNKPTEDELVKGLEHVKYEHWMLKETAAMLVALDWSSPDLSDDERVRRNALVESFAVHSRILLEFLWKSNDERHLTADCYVAMREPIPDTLTTTIALFDTTSERIVHLSRKRIPRSASDEGWDVRLICNVIHASMVRFYESLSVAGWSRFMNVPRETSSPPLEYSANAISTSIPELPAVFPNSIPSNRQIRINDLIAPPFDDRPLS